MACRQDVLRWGEEKLQECGIADWKTDAWLLYEEVTGISRAMFFIKNKEMMPENEKEQYESLIRRRMEHVPLQYITGRQEFMGLEFQVDEHVLIPRFDTEVLVLEVEKYLPERHKVLDMCTGSGCIAISLAKRNPQLEVSAVDYSAEALAVAMKNGENLGTSIRWYHSDLFECLRQQETIETYDIIVSNPPYIPSAVVDGLDEEVRAHEPRMALDGTEDGLEFYRRITKESMEFLAENGMLFYEIGHDQAEEVSAIMQAEGFKNIQVIKDLAGLDRVVYGGI